MSINENAWDKKVEEESIWTLAISSDEIEAAKKGEFKLSLGGNVPVPPHWIDTMMNGKKVLCLASGGGQQGPVFAAIGAQTTVLDISNKQLDQDRFVAKRDHLSLETIKGDMCDLSMFDDESFDLVFCPVSVTYIEDTKPVFQECYRILKCGGSFLFGMTNPHIYSFDGKTYDVGIYTVVNRLPFNSLDELNEEEAELFIKNKNAIEYSHTMQTLIGSQVECGFAITGFFESNDDNDTICNYFAKYFNTKAIKL